MPPIKSSADVVNLVTDKMTEKRAGELSCRPGKGRYAAWKLKLTAEGDNDVALRIYNKILSSKSLNPEALRWFSVGQLAALGEQLGVRSGFLGDAEREKIGDLVEKALLVACAQGHKQSKQEAIANLLLKLFPGAGKEVAQHLEATLTSGLASWLAAPAGNSAEEKAAPKEERKSWKKSEKGPKVSQVAQPMSSARPITWKSASMSSKTSQAAQPKIAQQRLFNDVKAQIVEIYDDLECERCQAFNEKMRPFDLGMTLLEEAIRNGNTADERRLRKWVDDSMNGLFSKDTTDALSEDVISIRDQWNKTPSDFQNFVEDVANQVVGKEKPQGFASWVAEISSARTDLVYPIHQVTTDALKERVSLEGVLGAFKEKLLRDPGTKDDWSSKIMGYIESACDAVRVPEPSELDDFVRECFISELVNKGISRYEATLTSLFSPCREWIREWATRADVIEVVHKAQLVKVPKAEFFEEVKDRVKKHYVAMEGERTERFNKKMINIQSMALLFSISSLDEKKVLQKSLEGTIRELFSEEDTRKLSNNFMPIMDLWKKMSPGEFQTLVSELAEKTYGTKPLPQQFSDWVAELSGDLLQGLSDMSLTLKEDRTDIEKVFVSSAQLPKMQEEDEWFDAVLNDIQGKPGNMEDVVSECFVQQLQTKTHLSQDQAIVASLLSPCREWIHEWGADGGLLAEAMGKPVAQRVSPGAVRKAIGEAVGNEQQLKVRIQERIGRRKEEAEAVRQKEATRRIEMLEEDVKKAGLTAKQQVAIRKEILNLREKRREDYEIIYQNSPAERERIVKLAMQDAIPKPDGLSDKAWQTAIMQATAKGRPLKELFDEYMEYKGSRST